MGSSTKTLSCSGCEEPFHIWKGYTDQGQEEGHGICKLCQTVIAMSDEVEWDKTLKVFLDELKPEGVLVFGSLPREHLKSLVVYSLTDESLKSKTWRHSHMQ